MTAAERGLTIVQPAEPPAIAPVAVDWDEQRRLFRQMVARNATDAEVDAIVVTCQQLGFVPVLRQVDLIDHQVYINHKGLWHLAHRSGMLNGIEVLEQGETDTHYTAQVAIYRKDMRYPFTYRGRYPKQGRNKQYGEEMALTRAECHALRRAFNVSLPVSEEINWSVDAEGQRFVRDLEVVDVTDQGRPGRAPAQLPAAGQAARVAQAGEPAAPAGAPEPEKSVEDLAEAMIDWLAKTARNPKQLRYGVERLLGLTEDQVLHEAWLATVLDLYEDQESRDLIRRVATPLVHQGALDAAWFAVMPPAEEAPAEEAPGPRPTIEEIRDAVWNGDLDGDVPF